MPATPPSNLLWDGFSEQSLGMNNGASPLRLPPFQASLLINATTRGDYAQQRPGIRRLMTVLQEPPGMFQHFGDFRTDAGQQFLITVVGGRFYRVDPFDKTVLEITIPGDPNPSILERGWSVQGETFWLYNDGLTRTFIFNGGSARRARNNELGVGTVIAYVQGRLWYAIPDGLGFRATDLVGNQDSGTAAYDYRDSILRETENDFLNEGGDFRVPANCGEITAMAATSILDTSQGQGPLQVLCKLNGFSVNTPVDRTIWKNVTYPIQTESLIGAGCSSAQATVNVNGDLFFRAPDGIRSFIIARRQFRDWGNTPQSFEMSGFLNFDQPDLLTFGSGAVIDNRYLTTLSPTWTSQGVYHRGLSVVDLAPITTMQANSPPVYDGLWTGLNILGIRQTIDGVFVLVLEDDGSIALWQVTTDEQFDDGDGRVEWTVVPRSLFVERDAAGRVNRQLKKLQTADLEYDKLAGVVDFKVSWKPDAYPCPTVWANWQECIPDCFSSFDCTKPLVFHTGYQPRKRLPTPPDVCVNGARRPLRNFYALNPRIDVSGPARILSARFGATQEAEPKYEVNTCDQVECIPIQCCDFDPFTYRAKGSEGGGSGSGSGSGSGGSGGPPTPPDPYGPPLPGLPPYILLPGEPIPACANGEFRGSWTFDGVTLEIGTESEDSASGVMAAWAASLWQQFSADVVSNGLTITAAVIVLTDQYPSEAPSGYKRFLAQYAFGTPPNYWSAFGYNFVLAIEFCFT